MPVAPVVLNKSRFHFFYVLISFHFVGIRTNDFPGASLLKSVNLNNQSMDIILTTEHLTK